MELFSLRSGHSNIEINIFHRIYTIIFYPFVFYFYIACPDQPGMREQECNWHGFSTPGCTDFQLQDVTKFMDSRIFESALGN